MQIQQIKPIIAKIKFVCCINSRHTKHTAHAGLFRIGLDA